MDRPGNTIGMRHIALCVENLQETERFYTALMGMEVEWRPDDDNVYLSSGNDNLALHRVASVGGNGRLDHIGFFIGMIDDVDEWFKYLKKNNIHMYTEPRTHRDGARSFYCRDPSGTRVQIIYHPPIANAK